MSERTSQRRFVGVSVCLFVLAATVTIVWSSSMSAMGGMQMPGGWTMSMMWMRMPAQTWLVVASTFLGMWLVMMVAMMLPSLVPMLWRYRHIVAGTGEIPLGMLTALAGAGYFFVWTVFGMVAFPLGIALATMEMQQPVLARVVPMATGVVVVISGVVQFTAWKARHLACCRDEADLDFAIAPEAGAAWRYGARLGLHCGQCCAGLMAVLLVMGMMNGFVMAALTAAITAERIAPSGQRVARVIGVVLVAAGVYLVARAAPGGTAL